MGLTDSALLGGTGQRKEPQLMCCVGVKLWPHLDIPSSSSSAALQPGVGFGLLYKLIPLLSIPSQLLLILRLEHFHFFEDSIDSSIPGSSCWSFSKWWTYLLGFLFIGP